MFAVSGDYISCEEDVSRVFFAVWEATWSTTEAEMGSSAAVERYDNFVDRAADSAF